MYLNADLSEVPRPLFGEEKHQIGTLITVKGGCLAK